MGIKAIANQFIADQLNARFATPGMFQAGEVLARITLTLHAPVPAARCGSSTKPCSRLPEP
jgi:hypothetical protein